MVGLVDNFLSLSFPVNAYKLSKKDVIVVCVGKQLYRGFSGQPEYIRVSSRGVPLLPSGAWIDSTYNMKS